MARKRGRVWRAIRNSPGIQISIYFFAFALLIGLYTYIFHLFYPVLENKPLSWVECPPVCRRVHDNGRVWRAPPVLQ